MIIACDYMTLKVWLIRLMLQPQVCLYCICNYVHTYLHTSYIYVLQAFYYTISKKFYCYIYRLCFVVMIIFFLASTPTASAIPSIIPSASLSQLTVTTSQLALVSRSHVATTPTPTGKCTALRKQLHVWEFMIQLLYIHVWLYQQAQLHSCVYHNKTITANCKHPLCDYLC